MGESLIISPFLFPLLDHRITQYQPVYYVAESFRSAKDKVKEFSLGMNRPFVVKYNAYTETMDVLDSKSKLIRLANNVKEDIGRLAQALETLSSLH